MGRIQDPQPDASDLYKSKKLLRTFSKDRYEDKATQHNELLRNHAVPRSRRMSNEEATLEPRKLVLEVDKALKHLLSQEDTDSNEQIAATDKGPKVVALGTANSHGFRNVDVRGTYPLSSLLQELALAKDHNQSRIVLPEERLYENYVARLSRMIRDVFWNNLTRCLDADGMEKILVDPKNRTNAASTRLYVPSNEPELIAFYENIRDSRPHLNLIVERLDLDFSAEDVMHLNTKPGMLALAAKMSPDKKDIRPIPFIVPGARFNELYNWDSFFISLGLIEDNRDDLVKGVVDHFIFQIEHYHKVPNGSRTYYLLRSQPPFLSTLVRTIYERGNDPDIDLPWLARAIRAVIEEYHIVWMHPRRLHDIGLSIYRPDGQGVPPETEASHFYNILLPYAEKHALDLSTFTEKYNTREIIEPDLDIFFQHDRGVRESGHDTTVRLEGICADVCTVDLCALLYKIETDVADMIESHFGGSLDMVRDFELTSFPFGNAPVDGMPSYPGGSSLGRKQTSEEWRARAARRKDLADRYLWSEKHGLYFDYNTRTQKHTDYISATVYWPMWSRMASAQQASRLRDNLHHLEMPGGLVSGANHGLHKSSLDKPSRQWDYPAAWPPHQMLAWQAFSNYDMHWDASRLAYRWLYMVLSGFVEGGGAIPEKFNVVEMSHNLTAEYGNQGTHFSLIPREGFGWTNASFQVGLKYLTPMLTRALGNLTSPLTVFDDTSIRERAEHSAVSSYPTSPK